VRRGPRIAATALVALAAGGGLAAAEDVLRFALPPEIVTDLEGPLFVLEGMVPGVPVERCVTIYPRNGKADRVFLSGTTRGALAPLVHQQVVAGRAADGIRAGRDCQGFEADRTLWSGTLDQFPAADAPLQDGAALRPGEPRVYRFRVWLPAGASPPLDQLAEQDLEWAAELDELPPPPTTPTVTVTVPGQPQVLQTPAPPPPTCSRQPAERPSRTFTVDGRRATFLVGPARRVRPGEPLVLRVRDAAGVVHRATYTIDGRRIPSSAGRPWKAALPTAAVADASSVLVRVQTVGGAVKYGRVVLRARDCPPIVRAVAPAGSSSIVLDVDPGTTVARVGVSLPRGVRATPATRVLSAAGPRLALAARGARLALGAIPGGSSVRVRVPVAASSRSALALARCAGSDVLVRLEPIGEPVRWVRVPLQGRAGGCVR
jgi:hypothetical protein